MFGTLNLVCANSSHSIVTALYETQLSGHSVPTD